MVTTVMAAFGSKISFKKKWNFLNLSWPNKALSKHSEQNSQENSVISVINGCFQGKEICYTQLNLVLYETHML